MQTLQSNEQKSTYFNSYSLPSSTTDTTSSEGYLPGTMNNQNKRKVAYCIPNKILGVYTKVPSLRRWMTSILISEFKDNVKISWVSGTWVRGTYLPNLEKFSRFFSPKGDSNWSVNKLIHFTDQFCQWAYNYLFCVK